ncbi:two-component regulator propeller domain-containing protein [Melioribacter sp. OK-6-Me]|uniref:two-component regulator propeller domain-containing protein n=1 Tax=unclassified Melioribacter TaxID=2627329 RepID=UPI003ED877C1
MKSFIKLLSALLLLNIFISCNREVYTGSTEPLILSKSKVILDSKPDSALIYIDGKNSGFVTPDTIKGLSEGLHYVTLKKDLFKDTTFAVQLGYAESKSIYIDFYQNPINFGTIYVNSNPAGALIYLNNKNTGFVTPKYITDLLVGEYKLRCDLPLHRSDSTIVKVTYNKIQYVNFKLDDTSKWVNYNLSNSDLTSNHLSCLAVDANNVWVGTRDKGIVRIHGNKFDIFQTSNSQLKYNFINHLYIHNNELYVATSGSLQKYDGVSWVDLTSKLPDSYVTSIIFDKNDVMWIGTQKGLVRYDGTVWKIFDRSSGMSSDFVTGIAVDNFNNIWVATNSAGVNMYDGNKWKVYDMSNMNLSENLGNSIKDIACDKEGYVYVAHVCSPEKGELGGLTRFKNGTWEQVELVGVPSNFVESIYIDEEGNKWIGTKNGLTKFRTNPLDGYFFNTSNSKLLASQVVDIKIAADGNLWIATFGGGLAKVKKGNF